MQGRQLELGVPRTTEGDLRRVPHHPEAWEQDAQPPGGGASGAEILRRNPMMTHLLEALEEFREGGGDADKGENRRRS